MKRVIILFGVALPMFAQSRGPAILSRGEAPSAMSGGQLGFQPFVQVNATYDTGLTGVSVTSDGQIPNRNSYGTNLSWGVSGSHSWRRTDLGLSYNGSASHYFSATSYDTINQALALGLRRQLSKRFSLSFSQSAGIFNRLTGLEGLRQTVPFDPSTTYVPSTEFYDDRTYYLSSQAALAFQKSARLSFSFGGGAFLMKHRATGLHGSRGATAYLDMQYRVTRRLTIGALYQFSTFRFTGVFGDSYIHAGGGAIAYQFTRNLEFSGFFGAMRPESKFIERVGLDPAIAALLGISFGQQVVNTVAIRPFWSARISRTLHSGVLYLSGGQAAAPGNGLFLTSYTTNVLAGYGYTGLRRWSFNASVQSTQSKSIGSIAGPYNTISGGVSVSRQLAPSLHAVAHYWARRYDSSTFSNYNRVGQTISIGLGFSPGNVPLRLW